MKRWAVEYETVSSSVCLAVCKKKQFPEIYQQGSNRAPSSVKAVFTDTKRELSSALYRLRMLIELSVCQPAHQHFHIFFPVHDSV